MLPLLMGGCRGFRYIGRDKIHSLLRAAIVVLIASVVCETGTMITLFDDFAAAFRATLPSSFTVVDSVLFIIPS